MILAVGVLSCLFAEVTLRGQSLTITSPTPGTVVNPGQTIVVKVNASGAFQQIIVRGTGNLGVSLSLAAPPYEFPMQIPLDIQSDEYYLTAAGLIGPGKGVSSYPVSILVEPAGNPTSLTIQPAAVSIWVGDTAPLRVEGRFGSRHGVNMTFSKKVSYSSESPSIATVDSLGRIIGVAPGKTVVVVNGYRVPVTVAPFMQVIPSTRALYAGQSAQFGAKINSRTGQTATWSLTPNVGTLRIDGPDGATYTAPASIRVQQEIMLTAADAADPTKSVTAVITLRPARKDN